MAAIGHLIAATIHPISVALTITAPIAPVSLNAPPRNAITTTAIPGVILLGAVACHPLFAIKLKVATILPRHPIAWRTIISAVQATAIRVHPHHATQPRAVTGHPHQHIAFLPLNHHAGITVPIVPMLPNVRRRDAITRFLLPVVRTLHALQNHMTHAMKLRTAITQRRLAENIIMPVVQAVVYPVHCPPAITP